MKVIGLAKLNNASHISPEAKRAVSAFIDRLEAESPDRVAHLLGTGTDARIILSACHVHLTYNLAAQTILITSITTPPNPKEEAQI